MAATVVDSLVVSLGLDPSDFQKGSKIVEHEAKVLGKALPDNIQQGITKMTSAFSGGLKGILTSFVGPLAAAFGGMAAINQYTAQADAIGKLSASIGLSAESMQAWGEAATRAGGSAEGFYQTAGLLNKTLQTIGATGNGRGKDVLDALGISVKDNGRVKDSFEILRELAGAAQKVGTVKFQGLAQRLGLDKGTIMLLQSGQEAVDELVKRQAEIGVYTQEDMEATANYNDAVADLQQSLKALSAVFLRYIIPPMTKVLNAMVTVVTTLRKHKAIIVTILAGIGVALKTQILSGVAALGTALKGLAATIAPIMPLITALAGIGLVMDDFVVWLNGGKSALDNFWSAIFGKPEEARKQFEDAWNAIKGAAESLWESIKQFVSDTITALEPLKKIFEPLIENVGKIVELLKSVGTLISELFGAVVLDPLNNFFKLISGGTGEAETGFSKLRQVVEGISDVLVLAVKGVGLLVDAFKGAIDWITTGIKSIREFADYVGTLKLSEVFAIPEDWGKALIQPLNDIKKWFEDFSLVEILRGWGTAIADWWAGLVDMIYEKLYNMMPNWVRKLLSYMGVEIGGEKKKDPVPKPVPVPEPAPVPKPAPVPDPAPVPTPAVVAAAFPSGPAAEVPVASGAINAASNVTQNKETSVNVGTVTINTQATDAGGIANDFAEEMSAAVSTVGGGVLD